MKYLCHLENALKFVTTNLSFLESLASLHMRMFVAISFPYRWPCASKRRRQPLEKDWL
uniref:Uncharacterized protein n=1 Tax=Rhizophora mucronata TaxID=61149 RepID=A0A2P2MZW5_RHIMU